MCLNIVEGMQTVQTLIRCCILQHLIWVYTVCLGVSVQILRLKISHFIKHHLLFQKLTPSTLHQSFEVRLLTLTSFHNVSYFTLKVLMMKPSLTKFPFLLIYSCYISLCYQLEGFIISVHTHGQTFLKILIDKNSI